MDQTNHSGLNKLFILIAVIATIIFVGYKIGDPNSNKPSLPKEVVYNSGWDASVRQVKDYLKTNLLDPNSYESINWGYVDKVNKENYTYVVRHKYRAKNSFGGYVIENKVFFLSNSGRIIYALDFKGE